MSSGARLSPISDSLSESIQKQVEQLLERGTNMVTCLNGKIGFVIVQTDTNCEALNKIIFEIFGCSLINLRTYLSKYGYLQQPISQKYQQEKGKVQKETYTKTYEFIKLLPKECQQFVQKINGRKIMKNSMAASIQVHVNPKIEGEDQKYQEKNKVKENYFRCHELVDETIINILQSYKAKNIEAQTPFILNKVTEIYDVLSQNIESIISATTAMKKNIPSVQQ